MRDVTSCDAYVVSPWCGTLLTVMQVLCPCGEGRYLLVMQGVEGLQQRPVEEVCEGRKCQRLRHDIEQDCGREEAHALHVANVRSAAHVTLQHRVQRAMQGAALFTKWDQ